MPPPDRRDERRHPGDLLRDRDLGSRSGAHTADVHDRRSLLHGARAARHDPARRADAVAVLVLVVVSLAFWSAIALWLVLGAR